MDSLIYSLNATLPVFLVIVVGYVLKQIGILNNGFVKTANKFNFVVTLPVLLFVDLSTTDIIGDFVLCICYDSGIFRIVDCGKVFD